MDYEAQSEQSITDDEKTSFLIELMLTNGWSDEYERYIQIPTNYQALGYVYADARQTKLTEQTYITHMRFFDYMHHLGLVRYAKDKGYVYEVSELGKKYLDKQRRKA